MPDDRDADDEPYKTFRVPYTGRYGVTTDPSSTKHALLTEPQAKAVAALLNRGDVEPKMKVIAVDNYNRESIADFLVCDNVNQSYGERFVKFLNDQVREGDDRWYRLVPADHRLSRGMADLV